MNNKTTLTRTVMALFLAMFCIAGTWAENVTTEQALQLAQNFMTKQQAAPGKPRNNQSAPNQLTLASKVSGLYVFNVENDGGFIIVSNDDRTRPILGFSETGSFSEDQMPDNMRAWLQGYADEIAWLQKQGNVAPPKGDKVGSHSTDPVTPLCTSKWNQDAPYNNMCPTYNDGWYGSGTCATGCVATAMAQVMYYHQWPASTTKVIPGYTTYSYSMSMSSLPVTTFDWANMKDNYTGSYTTAEGNAVAKLMKYCGYSVQMDYGPSSGAYTEDVAIALREYFDYNPYTTRFVSRSSFTYANWTDMIYHEVSHNRPVCYGGLSSGGGHEFVCDGYKFQNNTDFFHINWGWGGQSDNYFVLSALDPDQQGIGGSTSTDGFHYGQDAVIGIQKSTASGTIADIDPNENNLTLNSITLSSNAVEPNTSVDIIFNITNNGTDPYDGDIWLSLLEDDNNYLIELESVVIPAETTQDVVISYTPTQTGSYTFALTYINAEGEYVTYEGISATLVVAEGLSNGVVPIYGYWVDNLTKSQFVIAEANIEDMAYSTINSMTFTASQSSVSWGTARFDVYLSETSDNTISSLQDWSTMEKVYSGSLSVNDKKMTVTFDEPYYYEGGNLLVGFNQTATGSYEKVSWQGEIISGVSIGGYGTSISQQNFLPTTEFDFTPGETPALGRPKNVTVNYTGGTEAIVSWTSDAPAFDLDVNGTIIEDVTNPTTLTGLEYATTYNIKVRAKNDTEMSDWSTAATFTTDLSDDMCQITLALTDSYGDGWNGAAIKVVDVLSGALIGTFTNVSGNKGTPQYYTVDVPNGRDIQFQWVKGSYDSECSYAFYDVAGEEIYSGSGTMSSPFTYHVNCNACMAPTNFAATSVTTNSATLAWDSGLTKYNLRYKIDNGTAGFEEGMGYWSTIDADGDGYTWLWSEGNTNLPGYASANCVYSQSYDKQNKKALTPDNWLVSPKVTLGGSISFWAKGQDVRYYSENFGVAVSTTGNTDPADFTMVLENTVTTNAWTLYTVDLSAFSGEGYVAIRHYNVSDQFYLDIDDITITEPGQDWVEVNDIEATSCELTDLRDATNYVAQVRGYCEDATEPTDWCNPISFTTDRRVIYDIVLSNYEDNNVETIETHDGKFCNVTLEGRIFHRDNYWNTIYVPFDITVEGSLLDGADVRALEEVTIDGETVTLNFSEEGAITEIKAGTPYIIRWEYHDDNIESPVFTNVIIDKTVNEVECPFGSEDQPEAAGTVTFKGTYSPIIFGNPDKSILFIGGENTLYYPLDGARIGAQRAYFQLAGITADDKLTGVKHYVMNIGNDDPIGIKGIKELNTSGESWYDLSGRKLPGKPGMKGIYINGGKTVTVK